MSLTLLLHGRSYESYVDDLRQLADSLGVHQFSVIGVSGGGPYTYAAAALLPERVLGAMTISTVAQAGTSTFTLSQSCQHTDWYLHGLGPAPEAPRCICKPCESYSGHLVPATIGQSHGSHASVMVHGDCLLGWPRLPAPFIAEL